MAAHGRFMQAVEELGVKMAGAAALQNAKYGGWVAPGKDGAEPVYTDAPFTDTNEVITGFYQFECDEATARKIAALVPTGNVIEWRKVHELRFLEGPLQCRSTPRRSAPPGLRWCGRSP